MTVPSARPRLRSAVGATTAALGAAILLAAATGFAAPANALPAGDWWYGQLGIAKAQTVSTGSGVTVAVLDSGVKASLPDLAGRVLPGTSYVTPGSDGREDPPAPSSTYFGHGTSMAAFIAGTGKGIGFRGVAPGAKILPVQTGTNTDNEFGYQDTAKGIRYATDHGAKIISISNGGPQSCPSELQASLDYAVEHDVIVVAATGNTAGNPVITPANCIGAIAVGALADSQQFMSWSNESSGPQLDFVAPGENIRSLLLTNQYSVPQSTGTSPATAFAAGVFALLRSKFPNESARQIVTRAMWTVHNGLGHGIFAKRVNDRVGYGALLADYALTVNPPANATNPIYDEIDTHLRAAGGSASPAPDSGASSSASSASPAADSSDSGGISPILVVVIVAAVVVVVAIVVLLARRRPRGAGGYPPSGGYPQQGGYPPPR